MRRILSLNHGWTFLKGDEKTAVDIPHTWNAADGQDGGDDYLRCTCAYERMLSLPDLEGEAFLEFKGVNASAVVLLDGEEIGRHDGGYSTFRVPLPAFEGEKRLRVEVDNSKNDRVYPQTADFTFYGGIYRDVNLILAPKIHFDLMHNGSHGIKIESSVQDMDGLVTVTADTTGGEAEIFIYDGETLAAHGKSGETLRVPQAKLWDGAKAPNLYTATARLYADGELMDEVSLRFGFRTFSIDAKKGFFLNGRPYPLRGVCRHQDRKGLGNAITLAEHEEDIKLIAETGANTVRLAHYQHADEFYDLCDEYGLVVWAEIPYISRHMPAAAENAVSQMTELIVQQRHHACIVCWGLSNEITMFRCDRKDMLARHHALNDLCHSLDPSRFTVLACYAMCMPWDRIGKITDAVSWNLYLGWYVPGLFLNKVWYGLYRLLNPKRIFGMSEYGAEGMPNLHAEKPKRGDNTEEYQLRYHEYMLRFFEKHPEFWATHLWNMFDFAADARDQGGEPGMNHKGLVTFDRKTKKDAFYLYKAYWSEEPFVHLCGKRFARRTGKTLALTICTNVPSVELYVDGVRFASLEGKRVYHVKVPNTGCREIEVRAGELSDMGTFYHVESPDPAYSLRKTNTTNWQK